MIKINTINKPNEAYRPNTSLMKFSVEPASDRVDISWTGQPYGYEFSIRRDGYEIKRTKESSYSDYGVTLGRTYKYEVQIINAGFFFPVYLTNITIPHKKLDVTVSNNIGTVTNSSVEFKLPAKERIQGYVVTDLNGRILYNGTNPNFTIGNLQEGTNYTFNVTYLKDGITSQKYTLVVTTLKNGKPISSPTGGLPLDVNGFTDINNVFSKNEIVELTKKGIIHGVTTTKFEPTRPITRAEFMTLIVRITGLKADRVYNAKFIDVNQEDWYFEDLATAWQFGIIQGLSASKFGPNEDISREQAASIIARIFSDKKTIDIATLKYKDSSEIANYAKQAIEILTDKKIMAGYEDQTFRPKQGLNRAESAAIIYRLLNNQGNV
jgi:hypothetical protein